jgi:hypothetical protein
MSNEDDPKTEARPPQGIAVAIWGILLVVGCRLVEIFLDAQPMAASVGQAVLVEFGATRLGVAWTPDPPSRKPLVRAALGAAVGLGAALLLFAVLALSRGVITQTVESVEVSVLVLGFISAAVVAWRDELLLHGVTLRALDTLTLSTGRNGSGMSARSVTRVLACGVTSAGAALGRNDANARTVVAGALLGIVFGALWVHDRGAWRPWAANACFRFGTQTLLSGGLFHAHLADNSWAGGNAGWLGGTAATLALAPLAVLALVWTARTERTLQKRG